MVAGIEASREWVPISPGYARVWAKVQLTQRAWSRSRGAALVPLKPCVGHGFKTLLPIIFFLLRSHPALRALSHP
jgi:hypothetical protein